MKILLLSLLVVLASTSATSANEDSDGFKCIESDGKRCFKAYFDFAVTQQEALEKCANIGALLASIRSDEENNFIGELVKETRPDEQHHRYLWIGMILHRKLKDGKPQGELIGAAWMDGSDLDYANPLKTPRKKPWAKDQPATGLGSNNGGLCVQMSLPVSGGNPIWNDASCESNSSDTNFGYICQKPARP